MTCAGTNHTLYSRILPLAVSPLPFHPPDVHTQADRSAELNPHDPLHVLHPSRYADNPPSEPVVGKSDTPEPDTAAVVVEGSPVACGLAGLPQNSGGVLLAKD